MLKDFEQKIDIEFNDKNLLQQALTHRSYINEHKGAKLKHNERLEFLGDAVLELVITDFLFKKFPNKNEGELTAYRAALVNTNILSEVASNLNVNDYLLLSRGEKKDVGRARQYILANTVEAIIGAIFLDQGVSGAEKFVKKNILSYLDIIIEEGRWMDNKSRFQELAQERLSVTPIYQTIRESGPDHDKRFEIGVFLKDKLIAMGKGQSKQEAEQKAAREALIKNGWAE